jgi:tRNA threonylcarbamoyladenosine biosynthesis protein TsaB
MRGEREERLMPAVASMLETAGIGVTALDAIVCGAGPGSFTSLRIAASIAKGLAVALGRPLYTVPSLLLVATGAVPPLAPGRYAILLDAMRGELYAVTAEIDETGHGRLVSQPELVATGAAMEYADSMGAVAIGPAVAGGVQPHARGVSRVRGRIGGDGEFTSVDVDVWEPNYGRLAEAQVRWEAAHGRALSQG